MSKVSQIPVPWPGPDFTVTLRPAKLPMLLLLVGCVFFVWGGVTMGIRVDKPVLYVCAAFFALGIPVALIQLMPGAGYLTLKNDGLICCSLFRKFEVKWEEVQGFGIRSFSHNNLVVFDYVPEFRPHATGRRWSKRLAGCEGALPDTYGFNAAELAGILNHLRDQYLTSLPRAEV
jgi:hypothetical protein